MKQKPQEVRSRAHAIQKRTNLYRAHANDFKSSVTNNEQRASITKRTGISRHIKYSEKEGAQSPSVLSKAFNAIVGAVFLDSEGNVGVVLRTMWHLG